MNFLALTNVVIRNFESTPTQLNNTLCLDMLELWAGNKKQYRDQYGSWCACLKRIGEIQLSNNLLPF